MIKKYLKVNNNNLDTISFEISVREIIKEIENLNKSGVNKIEYINLVLYEDQYVGDAYGIPVFTNKRKKEGIKEMAYTEKDCTNKVIIEKHTILGESINRLINLEVSINSLINKISGSKEEKVTDYVSFEGDFPLIEVLDDGPKKIIWFIEAQQNRIKYLEELIFSKKKE